MYCATTVVRCSHQQRRTIMKLETIQPGYRVTSDVHDLVKEFANQLSQEHGFHVSANKALSVLIRAGHEAKINETVRS